MRAENFNTDKYVREHLTINIKLTKVSIFKLRMLFAITFLKLMATVLRIKTKVEIVVQ